MLNIFRKISNLENLSIVNLRSYIGHRVYVSNVSKFVVCETFSMSLEIFTDNTSLIWSIQFFA